MMIGSIGPIVPISPIHQSAGSFKMNKQNLDGRVAVVTGASAGIGRWAAIALAECGAAVAVNYNKNQAGAEEAKRAVESQGRRAVIVQADVSTGRGARSQIGRAHV